MKHEKLKKSAFIAEYIKDNPNGWNLTDLQFLTVILPCSCDYDNCRGWAAIPRNINLIDSHNTTQNPYTDNETWEKLRKVIFEHLESNYGNSGIVRPFTASVHNAYTLYAMYDFIVDCMTAFSTQPALTIEAVKEILKGLYRQIYEGDEEHYQGLLEKQIAMLVWLEVRLFDKEIVHPLILQEIEPKSATNPIFNPSERELRLSSFHTLLSRRKLEMKPGQKWKIRNQVYSVFRPEILKSQVDYTLELIGESFNPFRHFFLSEMLPIVPDQVELILPADISLN